MALKKASTLKAIKQLSTFLTCLSLTTNSFSQQNSAAIDASGTRGSDARDGSGYGGDAGRSTRGGDASNVTVKLSDMVSGATSRATVRITGEVSGLRNSSIDKQITIDSNSLIHIDASGGHGGDGGRGADGRDGRDGSDGRDATKYSNGTDGQDGEDGGPAGAGSAGSDGGRGGYVQVYIPVEDIHLALLLNCNVSGGDGGSAGRHGTPGSGGHGGSGGSSHSWTEQDGEDCRTTSRSVDNGNGSYTTEYNEVCTPRYRSYSNSGGSRGSNGSSGASAYGDTSGGSRGMNGQCVMTTQDNGQTYQGVRPFAVKVQSYTINDQNNDGIFEPLEEVTISNIKVKNTGDLPSPSEKAEFHVFFAQTDSTQKSGGSLIVPRLRPGQSHEFNQTLKFKIKNDFSIGKNQRHYVQQNITPNNWIPRLERSQSDFGLNQNLLITYPIEITPIVMTETAGAGQSIPIFWKVKNISGRDFGGQTELMRSIKTHLLASGGDAQKSQFTFKSEDGSKTLLKQNFLKEVLKLKAGQEVLIAGELQIDPQALPYTSVQLSADLWIDDYEKNPKHIQRNQHVLRISELYNYNPASEYLLITNKDLERESFLAWKKAIQTLGTSADIWDLSYYGSLRLKEALKEANDKTLNEVLANKTIVVLNNHHTATQNNVVKMTELVSLLTKKRASVVFVGGSESEMPLLYQNLLNVPKENSSSTQTSWSQKTLDSYRRLFFWTSDTETTPTVSATDPKQRYFLRYDEDLSEENIGLFKKILEKGSVSALRTVTPGGGRAVFVPYTDRDILDPNKIVSEETLRALLLPASFTFKLKAHTSQTIKNHSVHRYIRDSLIYDLVLEMDMEDVLSTLLPKEMIRLNKLESYITIVARNSEDSFILAAVESYAGHLESKSLRKNVNQMLQNVSTKVDTSDSLKVIAGELKKRKKLLPSFTKREILRSYLSWPAIDRSITTDLFLMNSSSKQGDQ